jgi:RND family efflux transporter MFP subunit
LKRGTTTIAGLVAAIIALWAWSSARGPERQALPMEVAQVTRRDLSLTVKATGVIKPMIGAEVRVGSRVSGVVTRLFVRLGDTVSKGQPLAQLDTRELAAKEREAVAALELATANENYALADLKRKTEISAKGLISANDLDLARRAYEVAQKQSAGAQATLAYARTQLDNAHIVAPIDGVVAAMSTQEGETVAASFAAPTFVTLLDLKRLEVWAYVDETDIGRIREDQKASFTVDTYDDREFEGNVTTIYPQAQIRDNVVNYIAVVRFTPPADYILRPEMTTTVRITLESRKDVLVVPVRAVRREGTRTFVLLPGTETLERRWIRTGSRDDSYWEVTEGLREGERVVIGEPASK